MGIINAFIDFVLHLDKHLGILIQKLGIASYVLLFLIIFTETGLVVAPFLPGDSLLFAAGSLAAIGALNVIILFIVLSAAAILGDSLNYSIGKYAGPKVFKENSKYFKKEYLDKTNRFYEKYGGKTIIMARFLPVVRTFAPFVAGVGSMDYIKFLIYNVIGGVVWVGLFVFGGYFFGNIPFVKKNFALMIMLIIILSSVPVAIELWKHYKQSKRQSNINY